MKNKGRAAPYLAAAFCLIAADQLTKRLSAGIAGRPVVVIEGIFELCYLENSGAAFGLLQNQRIIFIAIAVLFLLAAVYVMIRLPGTRRYAPLRIVTCVLMSGALGNLIDRIKFGSVRDFLYFKLIDFPVFNLADIYVTCAAAALFILMLTYYRNEDFNFVFRQEGSKR